MAAIDGWTVVKESFGTDYIGALRHMRDILLRESDWTQFTDSPLSDSKKTEWKTYRQNLRDLPATESDPEKKKGSGTAGYLFFQTNRGYVFRSIDSLVSTSKDEFNGDPVVNQKPFFWQPAKGVNPSLNRIQEIIFGQEFDMIQKVCKFEQFQLYQIDEVCLTLLLPFRMNLLLF